MKLFTLTAIYFMIIHFLYKVSDLIQHLTNQMP